MRAELFRWSDGQYHPNDPAANRVAGALAATAAQGRARLTFAVDAGHAGCVEQLITRGANISHCDHAQQTPMAVAAARGLDAIVATMLEYKLAQDEKLLRQIDVGDE